MRMAIFVFLLCAAMSSCERKSAPAPEAKAAFPHYQPSDAGNYFHYPHATMVRTQGEGTGITMFSTNYRQPADNSAPVEFHHQEIVGHYDLTWRFVAMTATGDEYHFTLAHHAPGGWEKPAEMDVVFKGAKLTVVDQPDIKIELFPEPPKSGG